MRFCLLQKIWKNLSCKYGQKVFESAKKSTADAIKTVSKIPIQKTTEGTKIKSF